MKLRHFANFCGLCDSCVLSWSLFSAAVRRQRYTKHDGHRLLDRVSPHLLQRTSFLHGRLWTGLADDDVPV